MTIDIRSKAAKYYDYQEIPFDDVSFYTRFLGSRQNSPVEDILELGCGTGRVLVQLAEHVSFIQGIDNSEAMIALCKKKLEIHNIPPGRAKIRVGDITDFRLNRVFDLIIAPFRVLQNIEEAKAATAMLNCIREHMAPGGSCILNVFMPYLEAERLKKEWCFQEEQSCWEKNIDGKRVTLSARQPIMNAETMILYPELIYRTFEDETLEDEAVLKIPMKCYYPDEFEHLIMSHGFKILGKWGGYEGEEYGMGPELVIHFTRGS